MTDQFQTSCGFAAVIGLPNAGKSTLMNALVGQKISITSEKKQTTRCRVLGIAIHEQAQIIYIDTPGLFDAQKTMERAMVGAATDALGDADLVLHVVDASHGHDLSKHQNIMQRLTHDRPVFLVLNKIDKTKKEVLLQIAQGMNAAFDYDATFMISGLKSKGLEALQGTIAAALPAGPWHYDEDEITDMPMRMMAAEITREKVFRQLHKELPYAALVETETWEEFDNGDVKIGQIIYVQRDSQKAIVLGKGGARIKQLGQAARQDLEEMFGRPVHVKLYVKVRENWPDQPESLRLMGLEGEI